MGQNHQVEVADGEEGVGRGVRDGRGDDLDDQHPGRVRHGLAAVAQDRHTALVVPVVQHALDHIAVAALGHGGEEVLGDEHAPVRDARGGEGVRGSGHADRGVDQDPVQMGVVPEDSGEQGAVAAADVHDGPDVGEVVGPSQRLGLRAAADRHRGVELRAQLRIGREQVEDRASGDRLHGRPSGAQALGEPSPGGPDGLAEVGHQHGADGARHVRAEQFAGRCQPEAVLAPLFHHAEGGQAPQQPAQGRGPGSGALGQLLGGQGLFGQQVGEPQPGRGVDHLGGYETEGEAVEVGCRHRVDQGHVPLVSGRTGAKETGSAVSPHRMLIWRQRNSSGGTAS